MQENPLLFAGGDLAEPHASVITRRYQQPAIQSQRDVKDVAAVPVIRLEALGILLVPELYRLVIRAGQEALVRGFGPRQRDDPPDDVVMREVDLLEVDEVSQVPEHEDLGLGGGDQDVAVEEVDADSVGVALEMGLLFPGCLVPDLRGGIPGPSDDVLRALV